MKNPVLEHVLDEKGKNTRETWLSILKNAGSVQHLDFLSDEEKSIFKTFIEIDPHEIIQQAGDRQRFIDQGQSINLKIDPNMNKRSNVDLIVQAWKCGVKSLYYHKSLNKAQELGRSNAAACQAWPLKAKRPVSSISPFIRILVRCLIKPQKQWPQNMASQKV